MNVTVYPLQWQLWPVLEWSAGWREYLSHIYLGPIVIRLREPAWSSQPIKSHLDTK